MSRRSTLRRPRRRALAALVLGAAALGPASATAAVPTITPAELGPLAAPGQISVLGDTTALTRIAGERAQLLVGTGGALPVPVPTASRLPSWGQPHLGTDAAGRTVVVYPACGTVVAGCDLRMVDVASGADRPVPGVNSAGGELEGTIDDGAVAFVRWAGYGQLRSAARGGHANEPTQLFYRPADGRSRRVGRDGGQQLALDGRRLLQVRALLPLQDRRYYGCASTAVELIRLAKDPKTTKDKLKRITKVGCGEDNQTPLSPAFDGTHAVWALRSFGGGWIQRAPLTGGEPESARVLGGFAAAAVGGRSSATLVRGDFQLLEEQNWSLARVGGLTYGRD